MTTAHFHLDTSQSDPKESSIMGDARDTAKKKKADEKKTTKGAAKAPAAKPAAEAKPAAKSGKK
jgi:hypothetical protein